jgi:hypothetical protein
MDEPGERSLIHRHERLRRLDHLANLLEELMAIRKRDHESGLLTEDGKGVLNFDANVVKEYRAVISQIGDVAGLESSDWRGLTPALVGVDEEEI